MTIKKYNIHTVLPNETIESIAKLYNIETHKLIIFHNNHCGDVKKIIFVTTNIQNVKSIYVPRNLTVDVSKQVSFKNTTTLSLNPSNEVNTYAVRIMTETDALTELKFTANVKWVAYKEQKHYFEVTRNTEAYINNQELSLLADILAFETSKIMYPLQIVTDQTGNFLSAAIAPSPTVTLKEKWQQIKQTIYKQFAGEVVDTYLLKTEKIIFAEPDALALYIKNDFFIRTLFFGVNVNYTNQYNVTLVKTFPVVKCYKEPNYKINLQIDPLLDDYNLININGVGNLHETRTTAEIFNGFTFSDAFTQSHPNTNGEIKMKYFLNAQTKVVKHAHLESSIYDDEKQKKITINISSI